MNSKKQTNDLKNEVMARLIRSYLFNDFKESVDKIPFEMRPKNADVPYRCCIHKERAILRSRIIAALGGSIREDDEIKSLSTYAKEAQEREKLPRKALTIVDTACQGCTPSRIFVTDLCQGCVARPCVGSCPVDAITIQNGKALIDSQKCINCTKCVAACPYNAITKIVVPCENACPVDAIRKKEDGFAEIDFDKCISCGACISSCPFGAVAEKSQMIDILKAIKEGKNVIAMLAPSVVGQLPFSINKIAKALEKSGFSTIYEVAQGADITAKTEQVDFKERMDKGYDFMTTSCCAAYNEFIEKHAPELEPFVSETKTPMHYTAAIAKKESPDCVSIFIGPCVAKRKEGLLDDNVDYVMTFEEMDALFTALNIEVAECDDYEFKTQSSTQGRNFAFSGGVSESVNIASGKDKRLAPTYINGLDKASIRDLKRYGKSGICPEGNIIEVMACPGGCVGGSCTINSKSITTRKIKNYAEESFDLNDKN